jgi:hypothetical protein
LYKKITKNNAGQTCYIFVYLDHEKENKSKIFKNGRPEKGGGKT